MQKTVSSYIEEKPEVTKISVDINTELLEAADKKMAEHKPDKHTRRQVIEAGLRKYLEEK